MFKALVLILVLIMTVLPVLYGAMQEAFVRARQVALDHAARVDPTLPLAGYGFGLHYVPGTRVSKVGWGFFFGDDHGAPELPLAVYVDLRGRVIYDEVEANNPGEGFLSDPPP